MAEGDEHPPGPADLRLARLERLQALTAELSAAAAPEDVARIIFDRGLSLVGARVVSLHWERVSDQLELVHGLGVSEDFVQRYRRLGPTAAVPVAEAWRTGEPVWLGDPEAMRQRFPEAAAQAGTEGDLAWAAIPLLVDRSRGALGLRFDTVRSFDQEERDFVVAVARQCAQALERARLFEAQRRLADRLSSLQGLTSELSAAVTPREVAAVVLRRLLGLGARGGAVLSMPGPGRLEPVYAHEADDLLAAITGGDGLLASLQPGKPIWRVPDDDGAGADGAHRPGEGATAAVPLRMEGRNVGLLLAAFPPGRGPGGEDRAFVQAVADQAAQALERARLYEAQRLQAERLSQLHAADAALSGAGRPAEVASAMGAALSSLGAAGVEVFSAGDGEGLKLLARHGQDLGAAPLAAEVVQSGKALWIESREELTHRYPELTGAEEGTWAVVPLLAGGAPSGAVAVLVRSGRRLEAEERLFLRMLAMPCAQALERIRLSEAAAQERRAAEWLSALLEGALAAVPVGLALLDEGMRVIRASERLARLSGLSPEAHRGLTLADIFPGWPAEPLADGFRRAVTSGTRVEQEVMGETRSAAGATRRFAVTWYPVRAGGQIVGAGMLVREVTKS
ncbi:MAG TPA: GAF domain-containing protein [Anaeromyxobacter sp.]|nr:GAF domain-containing protein [Anaeromyxobacter sp.]